MTYYFSQGSGVNINSANLPIDTILSVAQSAGYTIVDSASAGAYQWSILKNSSSNNGVCDYHIGIARTTSLSYHFALFEDWNTSSKTAIRFAPESFNPSITTWAVESESTYLPGSGSNIYTTVTIAKSGNYYAAWAKSNVLIFSIQGSGGAVISSLFYSVHRAGTFESFLPASADSAPVYIDQQFIDGNLLTRWGDINRGRFTRTAGLTGATGFNAHMVPLHAYGYSTNLYVQDPIYSKAMIVNVTSFPAGYSINGWRGTVKDIYYGVNSHINVNQQAYWTYSGSDYYARNINRHATAVFSASASVFNRLDLYVMVLE